MILRLPLFNRSLIRFGLVGTATTLIHVTVFSSLVELFEITPVAASVPAFIASMLASYGANRRWTFRAQGAHRTLLPKYAIVALGGLGLNLLITYLVVNLMGCWYGLALALVVAVVPTVTFIANRHWAFKILPTFRKSNALW